MHLSTLHKYSGFEFQSLEFHTQNMIVFYHFHALGIQSPKMILVHTNYKMRNNFDAKNC